MKKIKIAVAMSGGVDSGVAAALLVKAGYEVTGIHMTLWAEKKKSNESLLAAKKTAELLGIPFYEIDFQKIFKKKVVDYFLKEYSSGRTPNPCVRCNKFIKFGELLEYIRKQGYEFLATGHYARISLRRRLLMAKDKSKDQSYFLYNLTQKKLAHILFPVGNYTKKQVRLMAKKWQLPVAERPESQEICFLQGGDYRPFLKRYINNSIKPGEVVDAKGRIIGKHSGLPLYTIGQRHGFVITDKKIIGPLYVIGKDGKKNRLIVGFGKETERKEFEVDQVNQVNLGDIKDLRVRIRNQGSFLSSKVQWFKSLKKVKVVLDEPERGIAPGQAAVFYGSTSSPQAIEVLGGGIII